MHDAHFYPYHLLPHNFLPWIARENQRRVKWLVVVRYRLRFLGPWNTKSQQQHQQQHNLQLIAAEIKLKQPQEVIICNNGSRLGLKTLYLWGKQVPRSASISKRIADMWVPRAHITAQSCVLAGDIWSTVQPFAREKYGHLGSSRMNKMVVILKYVSHKLSPGYARRQMQQPLPRANKVRNDHCQGNPTDQPMKPKTWSSPWKKNGVEFSQEWRPSSHQATTGSKGGIPTS